MLQDKPQKAGISFAGAKVAVEKQFFELLPDGNSFCLIRRFPTSPQLVGQHCAAPLHISNANRIPNRSAAVIVVTVIAGCQGPMGTSRRPCSLNLGIYLIRVPSEWPRKRVTPNGTCWNKRANWATITLFAVWSSVLSRKALPKSI